MSLYAYACAHAFRVSYLERVDTVLEAELVQNVQPIKVYIASRFKSSERNALRGGKGCTNETGPHLNV
eukprot:1160911-Pelagomonas_calceolata.AAC.5